jgi:hypothetical protein
VAAGFLSEEEVARYVVEPAVKKNHGGPVGRAYFGVADGQQAGVDLVSGPNDVLV